MTPPVNKAVGHSVTSPAMISPAMTSPATKPRTLLSRILFSRISTPRASRCSNALDTVAWRDDRAAQIVEFAVSLPLLVIFVVGIFDFSSAYTLKQKLTNVARDAARVAAADPANDLANSVPASVSDAFWVVDNYLISNHINDCGISTSSITPVPPATWTFSGTANGCVGSGLAVTINRGYYFPATGAQTAGLTCTAQAPSTNQTAVIATCVSIQYSYPWQFGRVVSLLGSTITLPTSITATAVAMNEN